MTHTQFLTLASKRLSQFRGLVPQPVASVEVMAGEADAMWWLRWRGDYAGRAYAAIVPSSSSEEVESRLVGFAALVRQQAEKDREAQDRVRGTSVPA